jgi:acyl carrier protein
MSAEISQNIKNILESMFDLELGEGELEASTPFSDLLDDKSDVQELFEVVCDEYSIECPDTSETTTFGQLVEWVEERA